MHPLVPPQPWSVLESSAGSLSHDTQPHHPRWSRAWWQDQWAHRGHPLEIAVLTNGFLYHPYLILVIYAARWIGRRYGTSFEPEYVPFLLGWAVVSMIACGIGCWVNSTKGRRLWALFTLSILLIIGPFFLWPVFVFSRF